MPKRQHHPSTGGRAERIARLIVLDMIITPGLVFFGTFLLMAYQARANAAVVVLIVLAFLFAASVGPAQWGTMLREARSPRSWRSSRSGAEEVSPRPTSRGVTADADDPPSRSHESR